MALGFAASVRATANKQLAQVNKKITDITLDLFITVVKLSPTHPMAKYSKGEFINNWMATANGVDYSTRSARSYDGMASLTSIAALKTRDVFLRKDGFVTLTNNVPYAGLVEYEGWKPERNPRWSGRVGPYAPVRNAFIRVVPKYKQ